MSSMSWCSMTIERVKKVWGVTSKLIDTPFYAKHELEVENGGYCSIHYHAQRANRFTVVSGEVEIIELYGPIIKRSTLSSSGRAPFSHYDVPSMVVHMFMVRRGGTMYEEYYPDRNGRIQDDDIVRLTEGGIVSCDQLDVLPYKLVKGLMEHGPRTTLLR